MSTLAQFNAAALGLATAEQGALAENALPLAGGTMLTGAAITFQSGSLLRQGVDDPGYGGGGGIEQVCSLAYPLQWDAGIQYSRNPDGTIREALHWRLGVPSASVDSTKKFAVGSRITLDDGSAYVCSDATPDAAVWGLQVASDTYAGSVKSSADILVDGDGVATVNASVGGNGEDDNGKLVRFGSSGGITCFIIQVGVASLQDTSLTLGDQSENWNAIITTGTQTATRTFTTPDKDGTFAMTSDIPTNNFTFISCDADGYVTIVTADGTFRGTFDKIA